MELMQLVEVAQYAKPNLCWGAGMHSIFCANSYCWYPLLSRSNAS